MDDLLSSLPLADSDVGDGTDSEAENGGALAAEERKAMRQWQKKAQRFNKPVKKRQRSQRTLSTSSVIEQPVVAKDARAGLFAEWLIRHFGERLMRGDSGDSDGSDIAAGTNVAEWRRRGAHSLFIFPEYLDPSATHQPSTAGVVDVAGGKGHLAYLLTTLYHIPTTVIDPRPLNLTRYQSQYAQRLQHMHKRQADNPARSSGAVPSSDGCHLLTHFRCYFPASVHVTHIPHKGTSASPLYSDPLPPPPPPTSSSQQPSVHTFVDPTLAANCPSVTLLHERVSAATLLIGLHADGATEAIIDSALHHRKPFAVVPCCVFCNEGGQHRTVADSTAAAVEGEGEQSVGKRRVRSYEDFVAYLLAKDTRIKQHILPFQGRNLVLYIDPDAYVT